MIKEQKLMAVTCAMTQKENADGSTFYHFTDTAPQALRDLFLENFEVRDQDYDIFSEACDVISRLSVAELEDEQNLDLYAEVDSVSSVYTSDRIAYLNVWNESEISDLVKDEGIDSIAAACAAWYDREVVRACEIIREYVLA